MSDSTLGRWTDSLVTQPRDAHAAVIDEFDRVLGDAVDEAPLQWFSRRTALFLLRSPRRGVTSGASTAHASAQN